MVYSRDINWTTPLKFGLIHLSYQAIRMRAVGVTYMQSCLIKWKQLDKMIFVNMFFHFQCFKIDTNNLLTNEVMNHKELIP